MLPNSLIEAAERHAELQGYSLKWSPYLERLVRDDIKERDRMISKPAPANTATR